METHYEMLGIDRDASPEEIRHAYKRMGRLFHPDVNRGPTEAAATERFKQVLEAYEVLSNATRRRTYDSMWNGPSSYKRRRTDDDDDECSELPPTRYTVDMTLAEMYTGLTRALRAQRERLCTRCFGRGTVLGETPIPCAVCEGVGSAPHRPTGRCGECCGVGRVFRRDTCAHCSGSGMETVVRTLSLVFPPGVDEGFETPPMGGVVGVARLKASQTPFRRVGTTLHIRKVISLGAALCGFRLSLTTLDGRRLDIPVHEDVIAAGAVRVVPGEGMPMHGVALFARGDLHITFGIVFPAALGPEARANIANALGYKGASSAKHPGSHTVAVRKKPA